MNWKKILWGTGTLIAVGAPTQAVLSCSATPNNNAIPQNSYHSKALSATNTNDINSIRNAFIKAQMQLIAFAPSVNTGWKNAPFEPYELKAINWDVYTGVFPQNIPGGIVTFTVSKNITLGGWGDITLHFNDHGKTAPDLPIKMYVMGSIGGKQAPYPAFVPENPAKGEAIPLFPHVPLYIGELTDMKLFVKVGPNMVVQNIDAVLYETISGIKSKINIFLDEYDGFVKGDKAPQKYIDILNKTNTDPQVMYKLMSYDNNIASNADLKSYIQINPFTKAPILFNFYADGIESGGTEAGEPDTIRASYKWADHSYNLIKWDLPKAPEQNFWDWFFAHPGESTGDYVGDLIGALLTFIAGFG